MMSIRVGVARMEVRIAIRCAIPAVTEKRAYRALESKREKEKGRRFLVMDGAVAVAVSSIVRWKRKRHRHRCLRSCRLILMQTHGNLVVVFGGDGAVVGNGNDTTVVIVLVPRKDPDEILNEAPGFNLCTDTCNYLISWKSIYLLSNLDIYKWRELTIVGGTYHNTNFTLFHALSRYFTFHVFHVFHVTRPLFTSRFTPNPA